MDELREIGCSAGLAALGVAAAEPFLATRDELERRKREGLHAGMQFTYRNPTRSTDPGLTAPWARSLVVGARSYRHRAVPAPAEVGPVARVARHAWADHYRQLRQSLDVVAGRLRECDWRALVVADDNALVDREAAYRAGLGWYGKSSNLLLEGGGSWYVLGSVLTDAPLAPARSRVADGCGTCRRCLDACPTAAIVAPGVVDARRCLAWLLQADGSFPREHRAALGDRIYGCDECQEVCPPNRAQDRRSEPSSGPADAWVSLVDLLGKDDETLLGDHGRWYIARREPRHLRRNALVALGNCGDPGDGRVVRAIGEALGHTDGMVRAHAVWAAARLGLTDLLDLVRDDPDPEVRDALVATFDAGAVRSAT